MGHETLPPVTLDEPEAGEAVDEVPGHAGGQHGPLSLLGSDRRRVSIDVEATVRTDRSRPGAVARHCRDGVLRRAEPGPEGPLLLEVCATTEGVAVAVRGPAVTPAEVVERALAGAAGWAGCDDHPDDEAFAALVRQHPVLAGLHHRLGTPCLSRLPRVGEAVGRAILAQLVQTVEAERTIAQVAEQAGTPAPHRLWAWPTALATGRQPAWRLRRCGVSARSARALHEAAMADGPLRTAAASCRADTAATTWNELERRLRRLPGVGAWTAAEVRRMLGDPDAVSVGDYNLPDLVGHALGGEYRQRPRRGWTDEEMLELLAPYSGQRRRVLRLLGLGRASGLIRGPARRAPRAALSAHRYW